MSPLPLLLSTVALAAPEPMALQETDPAPAPAADPMGTPKRPYLMEVNVRGRWLAMPDALFDIWFYDEGDIHPVTGEDHPPRPDVRAFATGLEFVVKKDNANGIFYLEYLGNLTEAGYWDDQEDPPSYTDGDYLELNGVAIFSLGANYGFEADMTRWLSLLVGGGVGLGYRTGTFDNWDEPVPNGPPDEELVPNLRVVPFLDLNGGFRFNIGEHANIRLEGGFHNLFYMGAAAGAVF